MNRKNYTAPVSKVIKVKCACLLSTSVKGGGDANDIGWGGSGTGKSADSRGTGGFWDNED